VGMNGICGINTSQHAATGNNASVTCGIHLLATSLVLFYFLCLFPPHFSTAAVLQFMAPFASCFVFVSERYNASTFDSFSPGIRPVAH